MRRRMSQEHTREEEAVENVFSELKESQNLVLLWPKTRFEKRHHPLRIFYRLKHLPQY